MGIEIGFSLPNDWTTYKEEQFLVTIQVGIEKVFQWYTVPPTVQRSLYTVSLLHFARDFNNHINTHGLYWETWSARNGNDNMVDIKEGISDVNQFKWLALYDTFKPIIAMYFADGAEKPLDNFIETVTISHSAKSQVNGPFITKICCESFV